MRFGKLQHAIDEVWSHAGPNAVVKVDPDAPRFAVYVIDAAAFGLDGAGKIIVCSTQLMGDRLEAGRPA